MNADELEKTCRWLEKPGSMTIADPDHPVGIKKSVAAEIARLARLGAAVEETKLIAKTRALQECNTPFNYSDVQEALDALFLQGYT